ncbi:tyrosine-type recombinase/integrase [Pasteurella multocida]
MAVRKDNSKGGKWLAELYIDGKRVRRWFSTKAEANRFFNIAKEEQNPLRQIITIKTQNENLSDLINLWFDLYGQSLSDGEPRKNRMLLIADVMGNPIATQFTAEMFAEYRARRLRGEIHFRKKNSTEGIKARTLNYELDIFQAVFNELIRLQKWNGDNPLRILRPLKTSELEIRFLRKNEIIHLLECCEKINPLLKIAVSLCLATGARWSEMLNLTASRIVPYKVTFTNTKGGKNRSVPISPELYSKLDLSSQLIFDGVNNKQFEKAIKLAEIKLRDNQMTHVLRHTFASHFMMNGGNILVLKEILGHADISMTMIYAHFSPNHLETAVTLNPLNDII